MDSNCCEGPVLASAALAIQLSRGLSAEDTAKLGLFFTSLGDNLALIAGQCTQK